jgi:tRNA(Ile)-lysidine synthase
MKMAMAGHSIQSSPSDSGAGIDLRQRFDAAMDRLGPFESAPRLAVALSGGADSLALALLARDWADARGGGVTALVVDHGLRRGSADEAQSAAVRAAGLGIPAEVLTWDGDKPKSSVQAAAREARYRLLMNWCRRAGVLHLLAGHHADDQLETHLMRASRSGGLGAAGMSAVIDFADVRLLRPLLSFRRADLAAYLRQRGLEWIEDPSNADEAFERVRWRRRLAREDGLRGSAEQGLNRAADGRLTAERTLAAAMARSVSLHPLGFAYLDQTALRALAADEAARLLARLAQVLGGRDHAPPHARAARLASVLTADEPFAGASLGRCRFLAEKAGRIAVCRDGRGLPDAVVARPGRIDDWDGRFRVDVAGKVPAGSVLAPLGAAGWRQLPKEIRRKCGLPPAAAQALPALFQADELIAHAFDGGPGGLMTFRFRPKNSLAFNGFCIA